MGTAEKGHLGGFKKEIVNELGTTRNLFYNKRKIMETKARVDCGQAISAPFLPHAFVS